jgi:hypothetical protein
MNTSLRTSDNYELRPEPLNQDDDVIDLRALLRALLRGVPQSLGLALLGFTLAAGGWLLANQFLLTTLTTTRLVFSFPGFEKSQYPDGSKFQPEDLRAPDVLNEALKRTGLPPSESLQSEVRSALLIEGIIPLEVTKQRDRLRATGATPPPYQPDEYLLSLSLPTKHVISVSARKALLNEILTVYKEKFMRTYSALPKGFGNAFKTIQNADYFEFGFVLQGEVDSLRAYLSALAASDRAFRSSRSNLTFGDLLMQLDNFAQLDVYQTLSEITLRGATRDRATAFLKMDYQMRLLKNRELRLLEEEKLVRELLQKAESHQGDNIVSMKSQVPLQNPQTPILDKGLVDSLLANDSYNYFLRQALDAGMKVKAVQSEMVELAERRRLIEQNQDSLSESTALFAKIDSSVKRMQQQYDALIESVRITFDDYATQHFANAVRISANIATTSPWRKFGMYGFSGALLGFSFGSGLALLGIIFVRRNATDANSRTSNPPMPQRVVTQMVS